MEAATVTERVGAPPGAPGAPGEEAQRRRSTPAAPGWVEQIAGVAHLTAQTAVAAATPPYNWGSEFLEQTWLVVKRAFIPLMFCTAVFSWGAPGITGGSIIATLATTDRLGAFAIMASVRELATWLHRMGIAGGAGPA